MCHCFEDFLCYSICARYLPVLNFLLDLRIGLLSCFRICRKDSLHDFLYRIRLQHFAKFAHDRPVSQAPMVVIGKSIELFPVRLLASVDNFLQLFCVYEVFRLGRNSFGFLHFSLSRRNLYQRAEIFLQLIFLFWGMAESHVWRMRDIIVSRTDNAGSRMLRI